MNTGDINNILSEIEKNFYEVKQKDINYIVGISGIDCSGKSTMAQQLCEKLNERDINAYIVHGDDFLFEKKIRNANSNQAIAYYYESFDFDKLFNDILIPLKKQKDFCKMVEVLHWESDTIITREFRFNAPCILIVEGVFLFKKQFTKVFDYKIWMDIDFDLGVYRALRRERDINYYKDKEEIKNRYINRFYKGQKLYFEYDEPYRYCNYIIKEKENVF